MKEATKDMVLVGALILLPASCATLQALDPVQSPPSRYQRDTTASVEFVTAEAIIPRCIERGAMVLANACSDTKLITITNPCAYQGESYARRLCHEMGHVNGWPADHSNGFPPASESPEAKGSKQ